MEPLRIFERSDRVSISLKKLSLQYFKWSTCSETLSLLHKNLEFYHLESLSYKDGEINTANVALHEKLLYKYRHSLQKLEITNTRFESCLFCNLPAFSFDNMKALIVETSNTKNSSAPKNSISSICSVFPNLEKLSFGFTVQHYNDLFDLVNCKKLKYLELRLWIPYSKKKLSLSHLAKTFPSLESADLTFLVGTKFPDGDQLCRNSFVHIDGINELPNRLLANIRFASNCRMKLEE